MNIINFNNSDQNFCKKLFEEYKDKRLDISITNNSQDTLAYYATTKTGSITTPQKDLEKQKEYIELLNANDEKIEKVEINKIIYDLKDKGNNLAIRNGIDYIADVSILLSDILFHEGDKFDVGEYGIYEATSSDYAFSLIAERFSMTTRELLALNTWIIDLGNVKFKQAKVLIEVDKAILDNVNHTLVGTDKDDILKDFNGGEDTLYGGEGENILDGGDGKDTISYESSKESITVNLSQTTKQEINSLIKDTITNIENVIGSDYKDEITGNKEDNELYGNNGEDILAGGKGNDTLLSGADDDIVVGQKGKDTIYGGQGEDILSGGKGNDIIYAGDNIEDEKDTEDNILLGDDGRDTLYGEDGDDILHGGVERAVLTYDFYGDEVFSPDIGTDVDKLYGGRGNDVYIVTDGDTIQDSDGKGIVVYNGKTLKIPDRATYTVWTKARFAELLGLYNNHDLFETLKYNRQILDQGRVADDMEFVLVKRGERITILNYDGIYPGTYPWPPNSSDFLDYGFNEDEKIYKASGYKSLESIAIEFHTNQDDIKLLNPGIDNYIMPKDIVVLPKYSFEKYQGASSSSLGEERMPYIALDKEEKKRGIYYHLEQVGYKIGGNPFSSGKLKGGTSFDLAFKNATKVPNDPLVLDLNKDGNISTINLEDSNVLFDFNEDNIREKTSWISSEDGFLVYDKNKNGKIDNINELFGNKEKNGFEELKELVDSNNDNLIDSSDSLFDELQVWNDINSNGYSEEDELKYLSEYEISSINLESSDDNIQLDDASIDKTSYYQDNQNTQSLVANVNLQTDSEITFIDRSEYPDLAIDMQTVVLPHMRGYGFVKESFISYNENDSLKEIALEFSDDIKSIAINFDKFISIWSGYEELKLSIKDQYLIQGNIELSDIDKKVWIIERFLGVKNHSIDIETRFETIAQNQKEFEEGNIQNLDNLTGIYNEPISIDLLYKNIVTRYESLFSFQSIYDEIFNSVNQDLSEDKFHILDYGVFYNNINLYMDNEEVSLENKLYLIKTLKELDIHFLDFDKNIILENIQNNDLKVLSAQIFENPEIEIFDVTIEVSNMEQSLKEDTNLSGTIDIVGNKDDIKYTVETISENSTFTINEVGDYEYTPNQDYNGSENILIKVTNKYGETNNATLTFNVEAVNDTPIANEDSATTFENDSLTINSSDILANDTDVDTNDILSITNITAPTNKGIASLDSNGNVLFETNSDFDYLTFGESEVITLNYEIQDDKGAIASSSINLTIKGIKENDSNEIVTKLSTLGYIQKLNETSTSIDYWHFTHNGGLLEIDMLTEHSAGALEFIDLDGDNIQTSLDSYISLYKDTGSFDNDSFIAENDNYGKIDDGSLAGEDSYLKLSDLEQGDYVLAVGGYGIDHETIQNKLNSKAEGMSREGAYQVTIASENGLTIQEDSTAITKKSITSGTINQLDENNNSTTIDYWKFTHNGGLLEIDMLTEHSDGAPEFTDLDGDNIQTSLDSHIYLYKDTGSLDNNSFIAENDDYGKIDDGSIAGQDSYLKLSNLEQGHYIIVVGAYGIDSKTIQNGLNINDGSIGSYEITVSSEKGISSLQSIDNNLYSFALGDGNSTIYDKNDSNNDILRFKEGVNTDDVLFNWENNNLILNYSDEDSITIKSQKIENHSIENFELSDGSYLTNNDVENLIQNMISFADENGIDMTNENEIRNNTELMNIVSSSWNSVV